jgi:hypothetical protein
MSRNRDQDSAPNPQSASTPVSLSRILRLKEVCTRSAGEPYPSAGKTAVPVKSPGLRELIQSSPTRKRESAQ